MDETIFSPEPTPQAPEPPARRAGRRTFVVITVIVAMLSLGSGMFVGDQIEQRSKQATEAARQEGVGIEADSVEEPHTTAVESTTTSAPAESTTTTSTSTSTTTTTTTPPLVELSFPTTVHFGNDQFKAITITNTGEVPVEWTPGPADDGVVYNSPGGTLAPGEDAILTISVAVPGNTPFFKTASIHYDGQDHEIKLRRMVLQLHP